MKSAALDSRFRGNDGKKPLRSPICSLQCLEVGDDVLPFLLVLYAGEDDLRTRHRRARIRQVGVEGLRVPGVVEFLHGFGVIEIVYARSFAADNPEQARADLVLSRLGGMAERAFFEICLAGFDIGSRSGVKRKKGQQNTQAEV